MMVANWMGPWSATAKFTTSDLILHACSHCVVIVLIHGYDMPTTTHDPPRCRLGANVDQVVQMSTRWCEPSDEKNSRPRELHCKCRLNGVKRMLFISRTRHPHLQVSILRKKNVAIKRTGRMRGVWSLNPGGTSRHSLSGRRAIHSLSGCRAILLYSVIVYNCIYSI